METTLIKKILAITFSITGVFVFAAPAFAHVIVHPSKVGVAATEDFTMSVPNEKDNPVTSVRLLVPRGLSSVTPNAIPGWTITTKTNGSGDNAAVSEVDWTGGSIPAGQRAEFVFEAQVPAKATILDWKAYQTYSDGTVMSWDVNPATMKNLSDAQQDAMADKQNKGVYSTTEVVNDLTGNNSQQAMVMNATDNTARVIAEVAGGIAVISLILAVVGIRRRR